MEKKKDKPWKFWIVDKVTIMQKDLWLKWVEIRIRDRPRKAIRLSNLKATVSGYLPIYLQ